MCEQPDERWNGRPGEYPGHCEKYDTMAVLGECTSQAECMDVEKDFSLGGLNTSSHYIVVAIVAAVVVMFAQTTVAVVV